MLQSKRDHLEIRFRPHYFPVWQWQKFSLGTMHRDYKFPNSAHSDRIKIDRGLSVYKRNCNSQLSQTPQIRDFRIGNSMQKSEKNFEYGHDSAWHNVTWKKLNFPNDWRHLISRRVFNSPWGSRLSLSSDVFLVLNELDE